MYRQTGMHVMKCQRITMHLQQFSLMISSLAYVKRLAGTFFFLSVDGQKVTANLIS